MQPNEALEIVLEILRRAPMNRAESFAVNKAVPVLIQATMPKPDPKPEPKPE